MELTISNGYVLCVRRDLEEGGGREDRIQLVDNR